MFPSPDPRIYCLLQSTDAHPALGQAVAPPGLLSEDERARYDRFVVPKRRRDWLLGRWTAKHLVQSYLALTQGSLLPLDQIEIFADDDGAPYATIGDRLPLSVSISHSGGVSFCAVCARTDGAVGADVEHVEPRENSFVRTFFTESENRTADAATSTERDAAVTAMWSAKEAVLKTLRLGLRADTRQVDVRFSHLAPHWQPLQIAIDRALLPSPSVVAWQALLATRILSLALLQS